MSADQLGDNRPQLPKTDDDLARYLHSFAQTIRTEFNNDAFDLTIFGYHPGKLPALEDIINLFELEKSINWQFLSAEKPFGKGIVENFAGFDNQNVNAFNGELITHFPPDDRENIQYLAIIIRKPLFEGSEKYHMLSYSEHIEGAKGTPVSCPNDLYYYDGIGDYALVYRNRFSIRSAESSTTTEARVTLPLTLNSNRMQSLYTCPYPDIAFPGNLCLTRCWLKFCPRGLGPFDPGPQNPSAINDPRGRDPRGLIDPRGPR